MHAMKDSMHSRIDTKTMKQVHCFKKRYYCSDLFSSNFGTWPMGFHTFSSYWSNGFYGVCSFEGVSCHNTFVLYLALTRVGLSVLFWS